MNMQVDPTSSNLASAMLNAKIRPRAVVGYGVKNFHPSPPNYVTRSPGRYDHPLKKQEVILVDHTTSIKLLLWQEHCNKLEDKKTYALQDSRRLMESAT